MHISEGVLSAPILVGTGLVTLGFTAYAMRRMEHEDIPRVAAFAALFFVGSFISVPLGPTSIHMLLNGIVGAVLGVLAFPAVLAALLFQGLLFGFGGVTTLGANTLNVALPALVAGWLFSRYARTALVKRQLFFFLIGFIPVTLTTVMLALTLALNGEAFFAAAKVAVLAHVPLMFVEGVITMFALAFLQKAYPAMFEGKA